MHFRTRKGMSRPSDSSPPPAANRRRPCSARRAIWRNYGKGTEAGDRRQAVQAWRPAGAV